MLRFGVNRPLLGYGPLDRDCDIKGHEGLGECDFFECLHILLREISVQNYHFVLETKIPPNSIEKYSTYMCKIPHTQKTKLYEFMQKHNSLLNRPIKP